MSTIEAARGDARWREFAVRELRLWAGLILFAFVCTHLLNHAVGIFGLAAMEAIQVWRIAIWQSWPGTILLYGSLIVHPALALYRASKRRTLRMPFDEAAQIVLGLAIPLFLIVHISGTRVASLYDYSESYGNVLARIWPEAALNQILLLTCAWGHGCIGVGQAMRGKSWYVRSRDLMILFAGLVPALAIAGVFSAGREVLMTAVTTKAITPQDAAAIGETRGYIFLAFASAIGIVALVLVGRLLARLKAGTIELTYVGHGSHRITRGTTVLEASHHFGIPHPARCGGRGRCSTCRVSVVESEGALPPPRGAERRILERISAPVNVRLACQIRPMEDLTVQVLLPTSPSRQRVQEAGEEAFNWGAERRITAVAVNIRAFNILTRIKIPYDVVLLTNRFLLEMTQAVEAHGGRVDAYAPDGVSALFGLHDEPDDGARQAVRAVRDMLRAVANLNRQFGANLPMPLRVGIGIHSGPAIVAYIGDDRHGRRLVALGDTVSIAGRIESTTKTSLVDCLISEEALRQAGLTAPGQGGKSINIPGQDKAVLVYPLEPIEEPAE